MIVIIFALLSAALLAGVLYLYAAKRNMYAAIDTLLDSVLHNEKTVQPDLKEGEIYALSQKISRIQEKLILETGRAETEKEQIKKLISNMSHQLKTPLANIMLYAEILLEKENLTAGEREKFLNQMKLQTEKIDWILNSLFKMVKLEQDAMEFAVGGYSIKKTLASALSTVYEKALKKKIRFVMQEFHDVKLVHNPEWTAEVFANLFENAIKYSPCGSEVKINFQTYEMYSVIQIEDSGIGIPAHEQQKIFQRFYRAENVKSFQGSGIGLYLSKLIVEKENGYITVMSVPGSGSCFGVLLQNFKSN